MVNKPVAFLSYTRFDDDYSNGYLTELGAWLSKTVQQLTGQEFPILEDHQDVAWGQSWQARLEQMLDPAAFLVPILTPAFFKNEDCRQEVAQFIKHKNALERNDLILPIYYITVPAMEHPHKTHDWLVQTMQQYQYVDWRTLRLQPFSNPEVRNVLENLAEHIATALAIQPED
jgi:F-box protein 11